MIKQTATRRPTSPGVILKEDYLEPLALTVTALAEALRVSRKTVSAIVNERAPVTVDMALRLAQAFQTSPDLWLNLQRNLDLWKAVHEQEPRGWEEVKPFKMDTAPEKEKSFF